MRSLSYILLIGCVMCSCLVSPSDSQTYLKPSHIKGSWIQVSEKPSGIEGLYEKDTVIYRIGLDSLPDTGPYYIRKPMTFYVVYEGKGSEYGYIYDPQEEYDFDKELSFLTYVLVEGLPGPTHESSVTFWMPVEDSLCMERGNDTIHLKRGR